MSKIVFRIQQIIYDRDFQQKLLTKVVYYFKYIYQVYPVVTFSLRGILTVKKITQMIYLKLQGFTLKGQKKFTHSHEKLLLYTIARTQKYYLIWNDIFFHRHNDFTDAILLLIQYEVTMKTQF